MDCANLNAIAEPQNLAKVYWRVNGRFDFANRYLNVHDLPSRYELSSKQLLLMLSLVLKHREISSTVAEHFLSLFPELNFSFRLVAKSSGGGNWINAQLSDLETKVLSQRIAHLIDSNLDLNLSQTSVAADVLLETTRKVNRIVRKGRSCYCVRSQRLIHKQINCKSHCASDLAGDCVIRTRSLSSTRRELSQICSTLCYVGIATDLS